MPIIKRCPHCDAKMVEYRHVFNKGLAEGLYEIFIAGGGPINLRKLKLTRTQWTNFQKLRYWGLVLPTKEDGEWVITQIGIDFIVSGKTIKKWVYTYRGESVRFDGEACIFNEIHTPKYDKKLDYVANATPH